MKLLVILLIPILLISACTQEIKEEEIVENIKEELITQDNIKLAYNFFESNSNNGIILLHMLGRNKETWNDFALKLKDYDVIAIDLRGHGESSGSKDYSNMNLDVKAAHDFLKNKGVNNIAIIGASIGANIAINYASENDIKTIVLLSPGLDYRGVKTEEVIKNYDNKVLIVVSKQDTYSYASSVKLDELAVNSKLIVYENADHGTRMFDNKGELNDEILTWLKGNLE